MRKDDLEGIIEKVNPNFRIRLFRFKNRVGYEIICLMRGGEPHLRIGQFGIDSPNNNGSEIVVYPKYRHHAEEYQRLYEKATGKKASVVLSDTLSLIDRPLNSRVEESEDRQESSGDKPKFVNPFEVEKKIPKYINPFEVEFEE